MADELIQQTATETTPTTEQAAPQFDLAAQMAIALNGGIVPAETQTAITSTEGAAAATTATQETTQNDPFGVFKDKFGYETPDAAIKDIERLRAFEAQPRSPEFQLPDDESAAILRALAAGKKEEVWKALDHEMRIDRYVNAEVNKENAGDIVKMGMQLKYKDLTPEEINYKFNKQFALPPKPVQSLEEEDADYQQRVDGWQEQVTDKQMELMIEAKLAKPEISNAKGKYVFPEIETPVDEGYLQYKKSLEENTRTDAETKEAYKALTPKAVETKINFKDEANKVAFEFQYEPEGEKFKKAVEIATNADLFWQTFMNPDGTPNRTLFLESILYALDKNSIITSAMNQAKNATIKAQLPDNSQGGLVRQIPQTQEPNELEKNMRAALSGYGGF
jgi:hypothetical protein